MIQNLVQKGSTKILLVVLDGLGGLPVQGRTELEAARTPNMDALAKRSACGLHIPVAQGITPGSGPGHLALFGYDPIIYQIGRGILEALGLGMDVRNSDVAVRCNYASMDGEIITDRRAGRIPTAESSVITSRLSSELKRIKDADVFFASGMEHRFAVLFRFQENLHHEFAEVSDTDPQKEGLRPLNPNPLNSSAGKVAEIAQEFVSRCAASLKNEKRANFVLLRGFSVLPDLVPFSTAFSLTPLAIANYPMYRGLAKLVGMSAPEISGGVEDQISFLEDNYDGYDFFFLHVKKVDSYGEDGNFEGKVKQIEEFDRLLPRIQKLAPDVLILTGDHSTPALIKGHSWHPVPFLLSSKFVLGNTVASFSERECLKGELGIIRTTELMPLALANAGRLKKFGA